MNRSKLTTAASSTNHVNGDQLPLLHVLRDALAAQDVAYCQWKGHWKRFRWGRGEGDVDLLIDRADLHRFTSTLGRLGFKQGLPRPENHIPGVFNYYGFDTQANRLVHLHIYSQLILGDRSNGMYHLPIEKPYLESACPRDIFRVPAPEFEFIIFVLRMVLRFSWDTLLRSEPATRLAAIQNEFWYLKNRLDRDSLHAVLSRYFPFLELAFFARCSQSLESHASVWARYCLKRKLQARLRTYAIEPQVFHSVRSLGHRALARIRTRLIGPRLGMRLASGGALIALVGGDGAGKSTFVDDLYTWISPAFGAKKFHLGKPPRSPLTLVASLLHRAAARFGQLVKKLSRRSIEEDATPSFPGYLRLLLWVCIAYDRYRLYGEARRFAACGGLAICDRFPVPQIKSMDGPNIARSLSTAPRSKLAAFLLKMETQLYQRILPPDVLVVFRVDPETAVRRKPDENGTYVRARSREIWQLDWQGTRAQVVDASQPLEQVRSEIRSLVWTEL